MTVSDTSQSNSTFKAPQTEDLSKRLYSDICGKVASSSLLPCILDLCRALWSIMDSYKVRSLDIDIIIRNTFIIILKSYFKHKKFELLFLMKIESGGVSSKRY